MEKVPHFVDMTTNHGGDGNTENFPSPTYPYGLCICLCDEELKKLGLDDEMPEVGDMLHGHFLAIVKSMSRNDTTDGTKTRIELQITHLTAVENEDEENEDEEENFKPVEIKNVKKIGHFNPY